MPVVHVARLVSRMVSAGSRKEDITSGTLVSLKNSSITSALTSVHTVSLSVFGILLERADAQQMGLLPAMKMSCSAMLTISPTGAAMVMHYLLAV